jgi:hypothetical protein
MPPYFCRCDCPSCPELESASLSATWLGNSFVHPFSELDEFCTSTKCISDLYWAEWHDEAEITPWSLNEIVGSIGCDILCSGYGTYLTQQMRIEQQFILRYKMWYKRRWVTQLIVEECSGGIVFRLKAKLLYMWPWNATLTQRNRYRIDEQQCNPASPATTGTWVELGTDDGCEPGFPPGNYPGIYNCISESWEEDDCDKCDNTTNITINNWISCTNFPVTRTLRVNSSCNNCPDLLFPNRNRTPQIIGEWEYVSDCYSCGTIPSSILMTIADCYAPINFRAYGDPLSNNYIYPCDWLEEFPESPTVVIPCSLTATIV